MSDYYMSMCFPMKGTTYTLCVPFLHGENNTYQVISDLHCNFTLDDSDHVIFIIKKLKPNYKWNVRSYKPNLIDTPVSLLDIGNLQKQPIFSDIVVQFEYIHNKNNNKLECKTIKNGMIYSLSFTTTNSSYLGHSEILYSHPMFTWDHINVVDTNGSHEESITHINELHSDNNESE